VNTVPDLSLKLSTQRFKNGHLCVAGHGRHGVLGVLDVRRQQRQNVERLLGQRRKSIWIKFIVWEWRFNLEFAKHVC
jgi:hypothetical protein